MATKIESISGWEQVFKEIYQKVDLKRTPEQMWTAVMAHSSFVGESVRKVAFHDITKAASSTFCWLASFTNKCSELDNDIFALNHSLSEVVLFKYPNMCGLCYKSPCECKPLEVEKKDDKYSQYSRLLTEWRLIKKPSMDDLTIKDFKNMFRSIYGGRVFVQSLENIGFHFLEEIGESAVCVRELSQLRNIVGKDTGIEEDFLTDISSIPNLVNNYESLKELLIKNKINVASKDKEMLKARAVKAKMGLIIEIADSFSWLFSILNKLDMISDFIFDKPDHHPEFMKNLEDVLNEKYIDNGTPKCHICKKTSCECVFFI